MIIGALSGTPTNTRKRIAVDCPRPSLLVATAVATNRSSTHDIGPLTSTFATGPDLVTMVMWDLDSLDVAIKAPDGSVRHPVPLTVR